MGFFGRLGEKLRNVLIGPVPTSVPLSLLTDSSTTIAKGWGEETYQSDAVKQAITCIVNELKKTVPTHIRTTSGDDNVVMDDLQKLLDNPNEYMTTAQFLEKTYWLLLLNYNAFIIPTWEENIDPVTGLRRRKYTGLYPIQPSQVDILKDPAGNLGYRFHFLNGYICTVSYNDVIHLKYQFSEHEYMGGDSRGRPDNRTLNELTKTMNDLIAGVSKSLKASYSVNAVVKYNTMLDDGKMENAIHELEQRLKNSESGILPMDLKGEYIPIKRETKSVDKDTLAFLDEQILRHYGVSLPILSGDFTAEQHGAFYQRACEHIVLDTGQEFTKKLFTERERAFGNKIILYPQELYFMDTSQKLELFNLLTDTGSCYQNEVRTAFGMRPLPELTGKLATSSNKNNAMNNMDDSNNFKNDENVTDSNDEEDENDEDGQIPDSLDG